MFPTTTRSVYSINSPLDIGNVPIGSTGLSVAICLSENLMYIKSFQNGQPTIMVYRISPFQKENREPEAPVVQKTTGRLGSRLLEEKMDKLISGGKFNGLL